MVQPMIAFVFPGQGSQKPGMGQDLASASRAAANVFDRVSAVLGKDVRSLCWDTDEDTLRRTDNAQIALFTCGVAAAAGLEEAGIRPAMAAGHSVGEYAALAAAGVLSLEDGAQLVAVRGALMAASGQERPGTMAAILGLERDALEAVCREASSDSEVVVVANDNCPGQLVISGDVDAVGRACSLATAAGAKRALPLNVSGAFHSPLMDAASRQMGEALAGRSFRSGVPVYANVTADTISESSACGELLERQLRSTVRWTETVQAMRRDGATRFIECGVGEVLCGLIRRIDKEAATQAVFDSATLQAAAQAEVTA